MYSRYGEFTACFEHDLVYAESNGIKSEQNGTKVFYDTSIYLDSNGHVISGQESAYNNAVRANSILNDDHNLFIANCPGCPVNNKCCYEPPLTGGTAL